MADPNNTKAILDATQAEARATLQETGERQTSVIALSGDPVEGFDVLVANLRQRIVDGKLAVVVLCHVGTINEDGAADCAAEVMTPCLTPATLAAFIRGNLPAMLADATYAGAGRALKTQVDSFLRDFAQTQALAKAPLDTTKPN